MELIEIIERILAIIGGITILILGGAGILGWLDSRKPPKKKPENLRAIYHRDVKDFRGEQCVYYENAYWLGEETGRVTVDAHNTGLNIYLNQCEQEVIKKQMYEDDEGRMCLDRITTEKEDD